eukprot:29491-Eustigmatos_ZCMA.PRE.1
MQARTDAVMWSIQNFFFRSCTFTHALAEGYATTVSRPVQVGMTLLTTSLGLLPRLKVDVYTRLSLRAPRSGIGMAAL